MTKGTFDKLVRLAADSSHYEALCLWNLDKAEVLHEQRRAIEARFLTLLRLSLWVNDQW